MRKSKFAIKQAKRKITKLIKSKQEDYKANKDIHHLPSHVFSNVNNLQYQFFCFLLSLMEVFYVRSLSSNVRGHRFLYCWTLVQNKYRKDVLASQAQYSL